MPLRLHLLASLGMIFTGAEHIGSVVSLDICTCVPSYAGLILHTRYTCLHYIMMPGSCGTLPVACGLRIRVASRDPCKVCTRSRIMNNMRICAFVHTLVWESGDHPLAEFLSLMIRVMLQGPEAQRSGVGKSTHLGLYVDTQSTNV